MPTYVYLVVQRPERDSMEPVAVFSTLEAAQRYREDLLNREPDFSSGVLVMPLDVIPSEV